MVTVSNALVCAIVDGTPLAELDKQRLLAAAGFAEGSVRDVTQRTSIVKLARLWRAVLRATGDPVVGLTIGATVDGERFGLGARAAQHAEDLRAVLVRFAKYASLINDLLECRLEETPPLARFSVRLHWNVLGLERHAVDITFAGIARWARSHLRRPLAIHEIRVKHSLTATASRYREHLAAPVVFGASRNELVFDAVALDERVVARDAELGQLLERYATLELARIPVVTALPARVAQVVRRRLEEHGSIELADVAAQLDMSPRSLQRNLRDHSTSYSMLVDEARRSLAPVWLADPDANVEQVGFRLGYSEPTAFIRAFKKWYGVTPGVFRRARDRA